MRTLLFILTLLIGFQPASWAAGSYRASTQGETSQKSANAHIPGSSHALLESQASPRLKSHSSDTKHHGCLYMANSMFTTTTADCLNSCPGCCISTVFLELNPARIYMGSALSMLYHPPSSYSFVSLNGSPEIHPPRARIKLV